MVLLTTGIVLVMSSMLATLLVSEVKSFNRQAKTQDAYKAAKEGIVVALANLNAGSLPPPNRYLHQRNVLN